MRTPNVLRIQRIAVFVAVLVFASGKRCVLERRPFWASHPEIAYQLAVQSGSLQDHGNTFLGLADLYVQTGEEQFGGIMQGETLPNTLFPSVISLSLLSPNGSITPVTRISWRPPCVGRR